LVQGPAELATIVADLNAMDSLTTAGAVVKRTEDQFFGIMRALWLERERGIHLQHVALAGAAVARRYRVVSTGTDGLELGVVELKPNHYLRVVGGETAERPRLGQVVVDANRRDVLHVDAAPPAHAGNERGSWSRIIERGSPPFVEALRAELRRSSAVELVPE
jgi:hypothetical protein